MAVVSLWSAAAALCLLYSTTQHVAGRTVGVLGSKPLIYEIATRPWLYDLSQRQKRSITFDDFDVVTAELDSQLDQYPVEVIWFMGVWQTGKYGVEHDRKKFNFSDILPGYSKEDVIGSPYAIVNYTVDASVGTKEGLRKIRQYLNEEHNVSLILDFVPNHIAVDHPWGCDKPEYLVPKTGPLSGGKSCMKQEMGSVVPPCQKGPGGTGQAFYNGGDYWASGWTDTLQLNYWNTDLRKEMMNTLLAISKLCDGVRVDMAMDVVNREIKRTWVSFNASCETGKRGLLPAAYREQPKTEFWVDAIAEVRRKGPKGFLFVAEAYDYWTSVFRDLQRFGFDYTYDKLFLDTLTWKPVNVSDANAEKMDAFKMNAGTEKTRQLLRAVKFTENHDDNRAVSHLGGVQQSQAAVLTFLYLPGPTLFFHGQFDCLMNKLDVHLRRAAPEPPDAQCAAFFSSVLRRRKALLQAQESELLLRGKELHNKYMGLHGAPSSYFGKYMDAWTTDKDDMKPILAIGWIRGTTISAENRWKNCQKIIFLLNYSQTKRVLHLQVKDAKDGAGGPAYVVPMSGLNSTGTGLRPGFGYTKLNVSDLTTQGRSASLELTPFNALLLEVRVYCPQFAKTTRPTARPSTPRPTPGKSTATGLVDVGALTVLLYHAIIFMYS